MKSLPDSQSCLVRYRHQDPEAVTALGQAVQRLIRTVPGRREVVVVCIGTDRSTGDSLGPLTGFELVRRGYPARLVFGTIDDPVHAGNLAEALAQVDRAHSGAVVIAVDACLGNPENVGSISISDGPLRPGAGVNKSLPPVGEVAITGVVNVSGFMEYFVLQNTRLSLVMRMAGIIAQSILGAVELEPSAAGVARRPSQGDSSSVCALCRPMTALTDPSST